MTWGDELVKVRRYLRDPNGLIWSEPFLRHLWNDIQQDFQNKTNVLEDAVAQRVPGLYQLSYMYEWEYALLPDDESQFYQCLNQHDEGVFCHRWEPQQVTQISADVSDYGSHATHPWESYSATPADLMRMPFPHNFDEMKFCAYDLQPIEATSRKEVQSNDPSHFARTGRPICYYPHDESSNDYVLYPRPSESFVNELTGEGMALFAEDDTEDTDFGLIAVRTGSFDSQIGIPVDIVDVVNNVFMIYSVAPTDVQSLSDDLEYPAFLRKYIRYGVISRAYGANTDGRIKSLSDLWSVRYQMGLEFVRRYMRLKKQDRDYRMTTRGVGARSNRKHPRLPDGYPAV